ncbi:MAG: hypothetical protein HYT15_03595 [Candidatus Magasanikbacteria bacterium]|nr:hypothetical protein [Candidatus Magasanikbacteria bacterium]
MFSFISNLSGVEIAIILLVFAWLNGFIGWCTQALWYQNESRTPFRRRLFMGVGWPFVHLYYAVATLWIVVVDIIPDIIKERRQARREAAEKREQERPPRDRAPHVM